MAILTQIRRHGVRVNISREIVDYSAGNLLVLDREYLHSTQVADLCCMRGGMDLYLRPLLPAPLSPSSPNDDRADIQPGDRVLLIDISLDNLYRYYRRRAV